MAKLRKPPKPPPTKRPRPAMKKYNWEAIAMAARLVADQPQPWIMVGADVLRAHAWQINSGQKHAMRPAGSYQAVSRGRGDYGEVHVTYLGPPVQGDSWEALHRLLAESPDLEAPVLEL